MSVAEALQIGQAFLICNQCLMQLKWNSCRQFSTPRFARSSYSSWREKCLKRVRYWYWVEVQAFQNFEIYLSFQLTRQMAQRSSCWLSGIWSGEQYIVCLKYFEIVSSDKPVLTFPILSSSASNSCLTNPNNLRLKQELNRSGKRRNSFNHLIAHVVYVQSHVPVLIKQPPWVVEPIHHYRSLQ